MQSKRQRRPCRAGARPLRSPGPTCDCRATSFRRTIPSYVAVLHSAFAWLSVRACIAQVMSPNIPTSFNYTGAFPLLLPSTRDCCCNVSGVATIDITITSACIVSPARRCSFNPIHVCRQHAVRAVSHSQPGHPEYQAVARWPGEPSASRLRVLADHDVRCVVRPFSRTSPLLSGSHTRRTNSSLCR